SVDTDDAAQQNARSDRRPAPTLRLPEHADQCDRHAGHCEAIASPRRGRRVQLVQAVDEERDGQKIGEIDPDVHLPSPLRRNICSMRSVTAKPPKTLIAPNVTAATESVVSSGPCETPANPAQTTIAPAKTMP